MKRDLIIYCDRVSNAATTLAFRLNARRLRATSNRSRRRVDGALIVGYGTSAKCDWLSSRNVVLLNNPDAVKLALSKVKSYERFKEFGIPTLEFTTDNGKASTWNQEHRVLGRRDGLSSGLGIRIYDTNGTESGFVGQHDFYTKYFPKTHEYRVHVFRGRFGDIDQGTGEDIYESRVIDITQKKRSIQTDAIWDGSSRTVYQRVVRSHDNGWVHCHEDLYLPAGARDQIEQLAIKAVGSLGLDFGAVDILARFSKKSPDVLLSAVVCEVNTAPGLENEVTIEAYKKAILETYESTKHERFIPLKRKVRRLTKVWITTKKGNRVQRDRFKTFFE